MTRLLRRWRDATFGALLPARCLACGEPADATGICAGCELELPRNLCACPQCAIPLPQPAVACGRCLRRPPPLVAVCASFIYADPLDRLVSRLKFRDGLAEAGLLSKLLSGAARDWVDEQRIDVLIPIPLSMQRLRERGYNQALELARPLARAWQRPLAENGLRRIRHTDAQLGQSALARRRNLRGAFAAHESMKGRRVLLVDDVITTGSTLSEAARCLRRAGASEVFGLAVARVPAPPRS